MNAQTFNITNVMDKAVIASLILKTRLTMGPNNPMIPAILNSLHDNITTILDNYPPDWFTDEEVDWINSTAEELMVMSHDPTYTHLFDGEPNDE